MLPDVGPHEALVSGSAVEAFSLSPVLTEYLKKGRSLEGKNVASLVTKYFPHPWMGRASIFCPGASRNHNGLPQSSLCGLATCCRKAAGITEVAVLECPLSTRSRRPGPGTSAGL